MNTLDLKEKETTQPKHRIILRKMSLFYTVQTESEMYVSCDSIFST